MKNLLKNIKELKTKDVVIALVILALPFLFYIYKLAPDTTVWDTGWFVLDSNGFGNVRVYFWLLNTKLMLIISLSIWFITNKHWWRNAILVPLVIEINKIISIINPDIYSVDVWEFYKSLPIIFPVVLFLIYFLIKVKYYSNSEILLTDVDEEIDDLINKEYLLKKEKLDVVKNHFFKIKNNKKELSKKDYLQSLVNLKKEFLNIKDD
ncbi:hypothetical protein FG167_13355 [Lacinutrix sp. WUR7]|uniref:hypothetical protein n=1 Tax=Lacinutrix sp. WUR7 TaxID=2653681 RepID=UPI00193CF231|nr:hypothetical protein [Lacinutrix sp. WUR7]QRM90179.1 hypothetical protein FG167_13355 [Lacinutrix sp. WUR7]